MLKQWLFVASVSATSLLSFSSYSEAVTMTAHSHDPTVISTFSIVYDDLNQDGLLTYNEITPTSFSGVTDVLNNRFLTVILGIPNVVFFSIASHDANCNPTTCTATNWTFGDGGSSTFAVPVTYFDYSGISLVPLPAALPLFATGLGVLGLIGWRRKRKAALAAA